VTTLRAITGERERERERERSIRRRSQAHRNNPSWFFVLVERDDEYDYDNDRCRRCRRGAPPFVCVEISTGRWVSAGKRNERQSRTGVKVAADVPRLCLLRRPVSTTWHDGDEDEDEDEDDDEDTVTRDGTFFYRFVRSSLSSPFFSPLSLSISLLISLLSLATAKR